MKHVMGSFERQETAEAVIQALTRNIPKEKLSLITKPEQIPPQEDPPKMDLPVDGGLIGAAVGGAIGLAFAAGSFMLPGSTPLMVGWGPLFGILYGGMSGGVLGGLIDLGINPASAETLAKDVEAGKFLVSAEVSDQEAADVKKLMADFGADHVAVQQP